MSALTAGSLFSGIGGIDVAFAAAGFDIRFQVEIDPFCRKVLAKHASNYWPNAAQFDDVERVSAGQLGRVDVLFGGFPCQDISIANHSPAGLNGERSGLWREFARIIGDLRPRAVFLENVPAIVSRGGVSVAADLTRMGYDARWGIVAAADAGAPHFRDRWWLVAYADCRRHLSAQSLENSEAHQERHVAAYPAGRNTIIHASDSGGRSGGAIAGAWGRAAQSRMGRGAHGLSIELDRPQFPAGSREEQHDWEPPRQIAQRGPDWSARVKALGNAVVPAVVYPFAVEIARMIESGQHGTPTAPLAGDAAPATEDDENEIVTEIVTENENEMETTR